MEIDRMRDLIIAFIVFTLYTPFSFVRCYNEKEAPTDSRAAWDTCCRGCDGGKENACELWPRGSPLYTH